MVRQTGKHWSDLLQPAVLAMNSSMKKSHNQTPFKLMWGRESRYQDLLSYMNSSQECQPGNDDDIILGDEDVDHTRDTALDHFAPPSDLPNEAYNMLQASRESLWSNAIGYIQSEQLEQKRQFDARFAHRGR